MTWELPTPLAERLRALRERPIDVTDKGIGLIVDGVPRPDLTAAHIAAARPSLHDAGFGYPLLTLREPALRNNLTAMASYCERTGVLLAPHGKTGMSPELAARQLTHGAWGITVATIGQLRTYREFGFPRLLLANELVDDAGIAWLAAELSSDSDFEAFCYVDSIDGVEILDRVLRRVSNRQGMPALRDLPAQRKLPVLVEIGHEGGRTGCRTDEQAVAVARAATATGTLVVAGVAGYEGGIHAPGTNTRSGGDSGDGDSAASGEPETLDLVAGFCRRMRTLAQTLRGGPEFIITAGGSAYFDVVARELNPGSTDATVILRSGAYLFHDDGLYGTVSPTARDTPGAPALLPAIELWAQVLSRPEAGLALLGAGRRDVGFDGGLPVPKRVLRRDGSTAPCGGWQVSELNDQHAYLRVDDDAVLTPGDVVCLGISHPCTTLDKWRVIPVTDDNDRVIDFVHAFW